jgi:tRNA(fMet)-specific endonuclease VapC
VIRYLLDTNVVIALLKQPGGAVARRLRTHDPSAVGLSAIAMHELHFGAFRSERTQFNLAIADGLLFEVVPFEREDARQAGAIRASLAAKGLPIGPYDVLIAGQAQARGLVLASANVREFARIPELDVEDWSADPP